MALPGTRNYDRQDLNMSLGAAQRRLVTSNAAYGIGQGGGFPPLANNGGGGGGILLDQGQPSPRARSTGSNSYAQQQQPAIDYQSIRRIDALEQRVSGHDQQHRNLLEQMMKFQQEVKMDMKKLEHALLEERSQRTRMAAALQSSTAKQAEMEDRLRASEQGARESRGALQQLIVHTKNVERAVTVGQQEAAAKKEQQAQKLMDLQQSMGSLGTSNSGLERLTNNLRNDLGDLRLKVDSINMEVKDVQGAMKLQHNMLDAHQAAKLRSRDASPQGSQLSETQRAALEAKILQIQDYVVDVQSKLNYEIKERQQDETVINQRLSDLTSDVTETKHRRASDYKELESKTRELATLSSAEKHNIVMQISAVQTEMKQALEARDQKAQSGVLTRVAEVEKSLKLESKSRQDGEVATRSQVDSQGAQMRVYMDQTADTIRKMVGNDQETLKSRLAELQDNVRSLEQELSGLRTDMEARSNSSDAGKEGRDEVIQAKIDDLSDRLRLGMNKLQAAVGETRRGDKGTLTQEDAEAMYSEAMEGVREKMAQMVSSVRMEINELKNGVRRQDEVIQNQIKMHQQAGAEASTILGDKIQQKMDSVTFAQERMKRHLDDLQDKVQLSSATDIGDVRDRLDTCERDLVKIKAGGVGGGTVYASGGGGGNSPAKKEKGKHHSKHRERSPSPPEVDQMDAPVNAGAVGSVGQDDLQEMRRDLDVIMGRATVDTSQVSGIPSLMQLQSNIEDMQASVQSNTDGVSHLKDKLKQGLAQEKQERVTSCDQMRKDLDRQEKRSSQLKEKFKSLKSNKGGNRGNDSDDDLKTPEPNDEEGLE